MWQREAVRQGRFYAKHGKEFARYVVPAVMKPARVIWNQFISFLFCCFAVIFGFRTFHLAMEYSRSTPAEGMGPLLRLVAAGFCTALMLWFGIGSFLRARKISRS